MYKRQVQNNGAFTGCVQDNGTAGGGAGFVGPYGIVFNASGSRAYITNYDNNTVSRCTVQNNGAFTGCVQDNGRASGGAGFDGPGISVFNASGSRAYIPNVNNNTVSRCTVRNNGAFTGCVQDAGTAGGGAGFEAPQLGIVLH